MFCNVWSGISGFRGFCRYVQRLEPGEGAGGCSLSEDCHYFRVECPTWVCCGWWTARDFQVLGVFTYVGCRYGKGGGVGVWRLLLLDLWVYGELLVAT